MNNDYSIFSTRTLSNAMLFQPASYQQREARSGTVRQVLFDDLCRALCSHAYYMLKPCLACSKICQICYRSKAAKY